MGIVYTKYNQINYLINILYCEFLVFVPKNILMNSSLKLDLLDKYSKSSLGSRNPYLLENLIYSKYNSL